MPQSLETVTNVSVLRCETVTSVSVRQCEKVINGLSATGGNARPSIGMDDTRANRHLAGRKLGCNNRSQLRYGADVKGADLLRLFFALRPRRRWGRAAATGPILGASVAFDRLRRWNDTVYNADVTSWSNVI